ncbi:uncharacterized protein LOC106711994 [Papilio machaon]|uniref:uncharacterized protein LOC106711994 n=1 Tax=Papilio machaon TaxID=76193 RepID=UPI001E663EB8|nr:uncharacterized protein LOC106711994 [Papilio machaon]
MNTPKEDDISDEDIPSDFFDDFNKEEFMEGLSVIDSWDVKENPQSRSSRSRINAAAIDGVSDLRELIGDSREDRHANDDDVIRDQNKIGEPRETSNQRYSSNSGHYHHSSQLDNYIKPGSRRDLRKTNEAIRKDKAVKVKEYLSKHLDSIEDLKPPGTELDDFLNEPSAPSKRKPRSRSREKHSRHTSPRDPKFLKSPKREYHFKDKRIYYNSRHYENHRGHPYFKPYHKFRQQSPNWKKHYNYNYPRQNVRGGHSPGPRNNFRLSPPSFGARGRSPRRRSPRLRSPRGRSSRGRSSKGRSPHRYSPRRQSPRRRSRSRSPRSSNYKYSDKRLSMEQKDSFLYPVEMSQIPVPVLNTDGETSHGEFYGHHHLSEYPAGTPGYSYMQSSFPNAGFDYGTPTDSMNIGMSQPTPALIMTATPSMVPPPVASSLATLQVPSGSVRTSSEKPYDALAKLVVEGKLSKEDYLKLAPNKGTFMEKATATQVRVKVLDRCLQALTKLSKLELPNRLFLNNALLEQEHKSLTPKYCSPLKRQAPVDFYFTKTDCESETVRKNRQIIDNIISTIGLSDIVLRSKKNNNKNMADAAVQTTTPFCEVCYIRENTKTNDADTSIDRESFTATVHTQVVDEDLLSSKSVFNPSGGAGNHEHISIAHLTPAQLVSQLAARAKTLKQSQPQRSQFNRRVPGNSYDYGGGGSKDDSFYNKFSNQ